MNIITLKKTIEAEFLVESESREGAYYMVTLNDNCWECTCPDHKNRKNQCKHIQTAKEVLKHD